jgi:hypothetical protein
LILKFLIKLQIKWIDEKFFDVADLQVAVLIAPNYLSPAALPAHHKQRLRSIISKHIDTLGKISLAKQWQNVLSYMMNNDHSHLLTDFVQRTCVLDTHRNESFADVFPEFEDLLQNQNL